MTAGWTQTARAIPPPPPPVNHDVSTHSRSGYDTQTVCIELRKAQHTYMRIELQLLSLEGVGAWKQTDGKAVCGQRRVVHVKLTGITTSRP